MKSKEEIKAELANLNGQYKAGGLRYKSYRRKFSAIKNYNSVSNQVKRFGAKVIKDGCGYKYIGKTFNCDLYKDGCITEYWTCSYDGDNKEIEEEILENGISFETKSDLVYYLLNLDSQF